MEEVGDEMTEVARGSGGSDWSKRKVEVEKHKEKEENIQRGIVRGVKPVRRILFLYVCVWMMVSYFNLSLAPSPLFFFLLLIKSDQTTLCVS